MCKARVTSGASAGLSYEAYLRHQSKGSKVEGDQQGKVHRCLAQHRHEDVEAEDGGVGPLCRQSGQGSGVGDDKKEPCGQKALHCSLHVSKLDTLQHACSRLQQMNGRTLADGPSEEWQLWMSGTML